MTRFQIHLAALLTVGLLGGCCTSRDGPKIRHNVLVTGQCQRAFVKEWGWPTKTFTESGHAEGFGAQWTGGAFALRSGRTYDVWYYDTKHVTLYFSREDLVGWKWDEGAPSPNSLHR
jgi:hypothetical protein